MKRFFIYLLIFAGVWALRIVMMLLVGLTKSNLQNRKISISGILNVFMSYLFLTLCVSA